RLGLPLRTGPARRSSLPPLAARQGARRIGQHQCHGLGPRPPADYDAWAEAGNAGWDFHSVLPLFQKSEDWEGGASAFHGAGGPIHVERGDTANAEAPLPLRASGAEPQGGLWPQPKRG